MLNQYRSMLLEEMEGENWPALYPHLGEATIEACVSFFDKFDAGRTGRWHLHTHCRHRDAPERPLRSDSALSREPSPQP